MQPVSPASSPEQKSPVIAEQLSVASPTTEAAPVATKPRARWVTWVGVGGIALSVVFFGLFFVVPFLPLSLGVKGALLVVCWIGSESSFALGGVFLGAQVVRRYRRYFNPVNWFRRAPAPAPTVTPTETPAAS